MAPPRRMASFGMPNTTQDASFWAIVWAPARCIEVSPEAPSRSAADRTIMNRFPGLGVVLHGRVEIAERDRAVASLFRQEPPLIVGPRRQLMGAG